MAEYVMATALVLLIGLVPYLVVELVMLIVKQFSYNRFLSYKLPPPGGG